MNKRERYAVIRALVLVFKIALGKSNDEMQPIITGLIESGFLPLRAVPHQNTLSRWMNDPALTPVLEQMLAITARPFRVIERGGIVDSSKMSQMLSAHSRWVEYGDDEREDADWMKMHALVGVETLVCMAVAFSGSVGAGTHDINFLLPLVRKTRGIFDLRFLLADKAYLSEEVVGRLWEFGMQAVIPIKKRWDFDNAKRYHEPLQGLVRWYDKRQADFHEIYRLRPKIEAYFSLVKRVSTGFCWSRGRKRKDADGVIVGNRREPCTAWKNETLCKVIYVNLRQIVKYEFESGYRMNLTADTFFRDLPEGNALIA